MLQNEIIDNFQTLTNDFEKHSFIKEYINKIKGIAHSVDGQNNILDSCDFESDSITGADHKMICDVSEVLSLATKYSNSSRRIIFEINMISKLKIAATSLSHILINKPTRKEDKLESFSYGYLWLDPQHRIIPLSASAYINEPLVGVWVFGLDIEQYQMLTDNLMNKKHKRNDMNYKSIDKHPSNSTEDPVITNRTNLMWNPLVWASMIRFYTDEAIQRRISISSQKSTFLLANFSRKNSSVQFYQFRKESSNVGLRISSNTEVNHHNSQRDSQKWLKYTSLEKQVPNGTGKNTYIIF